jgi:uncharacterized membrane protein YkvA (DUF1232 family)
MAKNKLTDEEKEQAERYFNDFKYQSYSQENADKVIHNEEKIMDKMTDGNLARFMNQVKTFFRMIKAYANKEYKEVPVSTIVSIIMTLLYVFSPIDLIPDFLPVVGLLDDAAVLGACVASFGSAIKRFEEWEASQGKDA